MRPISGETAKLVQVLIKKDVEERATFYILSK